MNGSKSRIVPRRREYELDQSGVVQNANYIVSRSRDVRGTFSKPPKITLTLVPEVGADG